eukprot:jgi/Botrbrau1/16968/Bobra.49_2s0030.1
MPRFVRSVSRGGPAMAGRVKLRTPPLVRFISFLRGTGTALWPLASLTAF